MMRCRIPPENSCGYWRNRVGGMPICPSVSSDRARTSRSVSFVSCCSSVSRKWSSTRISGLSLVIGSWKIRPRSGPRSLRSSFGAIPTRFRPP